MSDSSSGNVGIVIVSHSSKIAEGAADMVRQMVGNAVPLAWTGGNPDGGLGTDVAAILESIKRAWSEAGVADFAEVVQVEHKLAASLFEQRSDVPGGVEVGDGGRDAG